MLWTGRVVSQYLSGTQTRRIGGLLDQYPEPLVEMHPNLAQILGIKANDLVTVESRRGSVNLKAQVVDTIREDTIFIPYHWANHQSANLLTNRAFDPLSRIPEYKVCAVRAFKAADAPDDGSNAMEDSLVPKSVDDGRTSGGGAYG
jgi:assimilatory nitrate reductase catalytic subunit